MSVCCDQSTLNVLELRRPFCPANHESLAGHFTKHQASLNSDKNVLSYSLWMDGQTTANSKVPLSHFVRWGTKQTGQQAGGEGVAPVLRDVRPHAAALKMICM